jgi:hypothetical protein
VGIKACTALAASGRSILCPCHNPQRNKLLVAEINRNHEERTPESLLRAVPLIKELNSNLSRVAEAYGALAAAGGPLEAAANEQDAAQLAAAAQAQQVQQQQELPQEAPLQEASAPEEQP